MADVVIYFVQSGTAIYECDLLSGTYFPFSAPAKLAARKAALKAANIPFGNWPGPVASLDEVFGKRITDNSAGFTGVQNTLKALSASVAALTKNVAALAVKPDKEPSLNLVTDTSTGAVYALGSGVFYHISSPSVLAAGQKSGLYAPSSVPLDHATIVLVRQQALAENSEVYTRPVAPVTPPVTPPKA